MPRPWIIISIHFLISFNSVEVENLKGSFYNAIDRQFGPGGIPPALIVVGATTAVATGGVLVTTGVADQIIDAITDFIGKWIFQSMEITPNIIDIE